MKEQVTGSQGQKRHTGRRLLWPILLVILSLGLTSCKEAPKNPTPVLPDTVSVDPAKINNDHLKDLPATYKDKIVQGKLSLTIDAQVEPVSLTGFYRWNSDYFDMANQDFQSKIIKALLGDQYTQEAQPIGATFQSSTGSLTIEPEKNIISYGAELAGELDLTTANFLGDEPLDSTYAEKAHKLAAELGFDRFTAVRCSRYGSGGGKSIYLVDLQPVFEGTPIRNSNSQSAANNMVPPYEGIELAYFEDASLWYMTLRAAEVDEDSKEPVQVIPLEKAVEIFKYEGLPMLSSELATFPDMLVNNIQLVYAHFPKGDQFELVPVWMFTMERGSSLDGDSDKLLFAVNAITGEIV